jgi:hypothetical protein
MPHASRICSRTQPARGRRTKAGQLSRLWQELDAEPQESTLFDRFADCAERALERRTMEAEMEAASWLDMDSFMGLVAAARGIAETAYSEFAAADGGTLETVTDVFTVPLVGNLAAIDAFTADPANLSRIAKSFRKHGLAAGNSNISVVGPALSASAAAMATPTQIRDIVLAFESACLGKDREGRIRRLLARMEAEAADGPPPPATNTVGGRLLLGARLCPDTDDVEPDYLGGCIGDTEITVVESSLRGWMDAMHAVAQEAGGEFCIELPGSWRAGLLSVAIARVNIALGAEIQAARINGNGPFELHVCEEEDRIWLAKRFGPAMVGPIDVPLALVATCMQEFMEATSDGASRGVTHENIASIREASSPGMRLN